MENVSDYVCPACDANASVVYKEISGALLGYKTDEGSHTDSLGDIHDCACKNCGTEFLLIAGTLP